MKIKNRVTLCATALMLVSQSVAPLIASADELQETLTTAPVLTEKETGEKQRVDEELLKKNEKMIETTDSQSLESSNKEAEVAPSFSLVMDGEQPTIVAGTTLTLKLKGTISIGIIILPEGISFDEDVNKKTDGTFNQDLKYNQDKRELTIQNISETEVFKLKLTADKAGIYKLALTDIDKLVKSEELELIVGEKNVEEQSSTDKKSEETSKVNSKVAVVAPTLTTSTDKPEIITTNENIQFSGNMTYSDATTNLNNTKIVVKVENGTIKNYTKQTDSTWFKTVQYDRESDTVVYTLKDGYTSGNFINMALTVLPKIGVGTGEEIKATYTVTGTNSSGITFETVVKSTSTKYNGATFPQVTPNSNSWTMGSQNVETEVYQGESKEIYPSLIRNNNKKESFKNARVVLTVSDPEFKDMLTFKAGRVTFYDNKDTSMGFNVKTKELNDTQTEIVVGEINADQVRTFYWGGSLRISKEAEVDKRYSYSYEIYDGEELIYTTMPNKVKILPSGNDISFTQGTPQEMKITLKEEFSYALSYKAQGSENVSDFMTTYQIPDGVDVTRVVSGNLGTASSAATIKKVEYFIDGQWFEATEKLDNTTYNLSNISEKIEKIKITQAENSTALGYQPDRIFMRNQNHKIGDKFQLKVEEISFRDALGEKTNLDVSQYYTNYTVIDEENLETAGALYEQETVGFDKGTVLNGDIFTYNYRLGLSKGQLEAPYIFVKVPKGMSVENTSNLIQIPFSGSVSYRFAPNHGTLVQPISKAETTGSFETADKKSVVYYYKADNTSLRFFDRTEMLFIANQFKAESLMAGTYEVEVGMGSLTKELNSMNVNGSGYAEKTLSAELKQGIGADISTYYSKTTPLTVGEVDKIETDVKVKGSADKDYVNATTGGIANVVPGQKIDYDITLTNKGSNEYKNFEVVNILPYVGDTLVGSNVARGSQFQVNPDASGIQVFYNGQQTNETVLMTSTSSKPERFAVPSGSYVSGAPFQSSNEITDVRSLNLTLPGITVKPGDTVQLKYTTNVPLDAKRPAKGSTEVISANNSLAYKVTKTTQTGDVTIAGEPVIAIAKTTPAEEDGILSGQVYLDLNKDGALATSEPGLNKVQLELFKKEGDNFVSTGAKSESAADGTGKAGTFGFMDLAHGIYKVKVSLPDAKGAAFITTGANGLDKIDEKTAWLKQGNKTELVISPLTNTIKSLEVPIYMPTPLAGKVIFTDKNDIIKATEYGKGYSVILKDAKAKVIGTTTTIDSGDYSFEGLDLATVGLYTIEFKAPNGKAFSFNERLNGQTGGELSINLTPGVGKETNSVSDIYITDADTPTGSLELVGAIGTNKDINPSSVKLTATDATTDVTSVWTIKDSEGKESYTGSSQADLDNAIALLISDGRYGKHRVELVVTDAAGNLNAKSITSDFVVAAKPEIAITNPKISFTTKDKVDEAAILAKALATTTTYPAGLNVMITTNTATVIPDSKVQGSYTVTVTAADENGLVSLPKTITVEITDVRVNVTYIVEGKESSKAEVVYHKVIAKPTDPIKAGYNFTGWVKADKTIWNFATDVAPEADFVLTAQFEAADQIISFDVNGGDSKEPASIKAKTDSKVDLTTVAVPTRSGYSFAGWYVGDIKYEGTLPMPADGLTLVAKWTAENQTISFDMTGGSPQQSDIVAVTDSEVNLDDLTVPAKDGYQFIGWFDDEIQITGTILMPAGGLRLTAKWTATDQVITFDTAKGSGVNSIVLPTDAEVDLDESVTTRAGYSFVGWYVDETKYEGVISMPARGLALTAKWTAEDQTITFDLSGGDPRTRPDNIVQHTDSQVSLKEIAIPVRESFEFAGWVNPAGQLMEDTFTMPPGGLNLKAKWTDLVANGTWKLKADDFKISLSDLKKLDTTDKLKTTITSASKAQIVDNNNQVVVVGKDLSVDTTAVKVAIGEQKIHMSYKAKDYTKVEGKGNTKNFVDNTLDSEDYPISTIEKTITMTVYEDTPPIGTGGGNTTDGIRNKSSLVTNNEKAISYRQGQLPKTGETKSILTWLIGLTAIACGSVLLWFRKRIVRD